MANFKKCGRCEGFGQIGGWGQSCPDCGGWGFDIEDLRDRYTRFATQLPAALLHHVHSLEARNAIRAAVGLPLEEVNPPRSHLQSPG